MLRFNLKIFSFLLKLKWLFLQWFFCAGKRVCRIYSEGDIYAVILVWRITFLKEIFLKDRISAGTFFAVIFFRRSISLKDDTSAGHHFAVIFFWRRFSCSDYFWRRPKSAVIFFAGVLSAVIFFAVILSLSHQILGIHFIVKWDCVETRKPFWNSSLCCVFDFEKNSGKTQPVKSFVYFYTLSENDPNYLGNRSWS